MWNTDGSLQLRFETGGVTVREGDAARNQPDTAPPDGGPPLLDPEEVWLHQVTGGVVRLTLRDRSYLQVNCYRAFPLSAADEWAVFFAGDGSLIGMLEEPGLLAVDSRAVCHEALELRYVVPRVRVVVGVREEYREDEWNPAQVWDVETDRGPLRLHLPNLADHVRPLEDGRLLFTDRDERRCLLEPSALDGRSRALATRYLWLDDAKI